SRSGDVGGRCGGAPRQDAGRRPRHGGGRGGAPRWAVHARRQKGGPVRARRGAERSAHARGGKPAASVARSISGGPKLLRRMARRVRPRSLLPPELARVGHRRADLVPTLDYWITSSARSRSDGGMVRPSAFVVFISMTGPIGYRRLAEAFRMPFGC